MSSSLASSTPSYGSSTILFLPNYFCLLTPTIFKVFLIHSIYGLPLSLDSMGYHSVLAPVSYTHLDVYKRQVKSCSNILGGLVPFINSCGVNPVDSWVVLFSHSSTFFT